MTKNPLFSIVTINYNNATGLKNTMLSVLNQNFDDFEYIIIDGGSSDTSKSIIEEILKTHPASAKVTFWCSEKDNGIYNAMNKGISHCNGQFIGLMNSGDFYCENVFAQIAKTAQKYPNSILYGANSHFDKDEFMFVYCPTYKELPKRMIPHCGSFVPTNIYKKYGAYDEKYKIASDYDAFLRFFYAGVDFQFLDIILYHFFVDGISNNKNYKKLLHKEDRHIKKIHNPKQTFFARCIRFTKELIEDIKIFMGRF